MIFAIGAFDGFHIGHQKLLLTARKRAEERKTQWGVITFDQNPQTLFNKKEFRALFTSDERDLLIKYLAIPCIVKIPFTHNFANMKPEDFMNYIANKEDIHGLVVGENFRFGMARVGTPEVLAELCAKKGWTADVVESLKIDNEVISSTLIRESLLRGEAEKAARLLGHPFFVSGKVIKGDMRGRTLGFPTANIALRNDKIYPVRGSYTSLTYIDNKWYPAALNIGFNPTFSGRRKLRCETHIVGYDGNLYGKTIFVFVVSHNRGEIKFQDAEALSDQLAIDIQTVNAKATAYLEKHTEELRKFGEYQL